MERRRSTGARPAGILPAAIFIAAAAIVLAHIGRYGITFVEARFLHDARQLALWTAGRATTEEVWFGAEHPSPAKILGALGWFLVGDYRALRVLPAILYAFAAAVFYAVVRRPRGPVAGYAAVAALVLAPPFFAFAAQASIESVVSSLVLILLALASRARTAKEWAVAGFVGGIALGTKITALVALVAVPVWAWRSAPSGNFSRRALAAFLGAAALGFLAAWPVLLIHPFAVLDHVAHFARRADDPSGGMIFFGLVDRAPWYYAPVWLLIGLPPLLIFGAAVELVRGAGPLTKLLRLYSFAGLAAAIAFHAYLREGIRHLLPVAVVIAVAGGLGAGRVAGSSRLRAIVVLVLFVGSFVYSVTILHPAESFYVSEIFGGPAAALRWKLPVTSSGDVLTPELARELPDGTYAAIPGAACDRTPEFADEFWRDAMNRRALRSSGGRVSFTTSRDADYLLLIGPGEMIGAPMLERAGVVYLARVRNPIGFELILTDTGPVIPRRPPH